MLIRGIQTDGKPYEEYESSKNPMAPHGMAWVDRALAKLKELRSRPKIEAPPVTRDTAPPAKGWSEIGKNAEGRTLYEDQRGVRSYVESGVRITEPVAMIPKRGGGFDISVDHKDEWQLASEKPDGLANQSSANQEAPKEPTLGAVSHITTAYLQKLAKRVATENLAGKAEVRREVDDLMVQMDAEGKKIAEHCLETGGKFSVR